MCFTNVQVSALSRRSAWISARIYHSSSCSHKFTCLLLVILQGGVLPSFSDLFPICLPFLFAFLKIDRYASSLLLRDVKLVRTRATRGSTWSTTCVRARLLLWSQSWESHLPFSWAHLTRMDIVTKADEVWPSFPCHTFTWVERTNERD